MQVTILPKLLLQSQALMVSLLRQAVSMVSLIFGKNDGAPLKISLADGSVLGFSPNSDILATSSFIYDVGVRNLKRQDQKRISIGVQVESG